MSADPYNLQRFLEAQTSDYQTALAELRAGQKRTHWIWYIFPQLRGLGQSEMAQRYSIASLVEARAYLAHPVLGPRLRECLIALASQTAGTIARTMGELDAKKLRSCLTLFQAAADGTNDNAIFTEALARLFNGKSDDRTLEMLKHV